MTPTEAKKAVAAVNEPKKQRRSSAPSDYEAFGGVLSRKKKKFIFSELEIINELSGKPTHQATHLMFLWVILGINDWPGRHRRNIFKFD
jgi:hypothetical protein